MGPERCISDINVNSSQHDGELANSETGKRFLLSGAGTGGQERAFSDINVNISREAGRPLCASFSHTSGAWEALCASYSHF